MLALQQAFCERADVRMRISPGEREPCYAPIYRADGTIGPGANEKPDDPELALLASKARSTGRQLTAAELHALSEEATASPGENPKVKRKKESRAGSGGISDE